MRLWLAIPTRPILSRQKQKTVCLAPIFNPLCNSSAALESLQSDSDYLVLYHH